jgi:hypothetical protein
MWSRGQDLPTEWEQLILIYCYTVNEMFINVSIFEDMNSVQTRVYPDPTAWRGDSDSPANTTQCRQILSVVSLQNLTLSWSYKHEPPSTSLNVIWGQCGCVPAWPSHRLASSRSVPALSRKHKVLICHWPLCALQNQWHLDLVSQCSEIGHMWLCQLVRLISTPIP